MSDNLTYTRRFSAPEIDRREILRYAGVIESTPEVEGLLDQCINEAEKQLNYKVCYGFCNIEVGESEIDLGFCKVNSSSLVKTLVGCTGAIVFCATVGVGIDRLIAKYNLISPSKAVIMQALGSERVEALCEVFCSEIKTDCEKQFFACTKRFSPGYGDLPLDLQREIFSYLDCQRKIGVSLGETLFMTPSKSVTAIIGLRNVNK